MTLPRVVAAVPGARKVGDHYVGRCMAHESKSGTTLVISVGRDGRRIVVHDHGGCSTDEVLLAHGLRYADLFVDDRDVCSGPTQFTRPPAPAVTTPAAEPRPLSQYGENLWRASNPIDGDAKAYLEARRCAIPPKDGDLRWYPRLRHPSGYSGPALVALVTHAVTRLPMTLHRTWIHPNGKKADVDPPRMLLKGGTKKGGVVRLWPDDAVTSSLAIAEGIETSLSVAPAHAPVWAAVDAGNVAAFPVLDGIESLLVCADNDPAGRAAAKACGQRWASARRNVSIAMPEVEGQDFNDLALAS